MNGKQAKRIRRGARALTTGQPERAYGRHPQTGAIHLLGNSTRGLTQRAKRAFRRYGPNG